MKIGSLKNTFFFKFLVSILLTVTLNPLNLTSPEEDFFLALGEYQDVVDSEYGLYSTVRSQSRVRDFDDQYFAKDFTLDCLQYRILNSILIFTELFVVSKLLSYRFISLPPPA